MAANVKNVRVCPNGHHYYKSSDCPVCPVCEKNKEVTETFLSKIGAPARRALESAGATTLLKLSQFTESEILKLHGMGPSTIPKLREALEDVGLSFQNKNGK